MTAASLNSYELGKGRAAMFLTSWFFVIGSLLLLARLAIHARLFTQAFVDAVKPSTELRPIRPQDLRIFLAPPPGGIRCRSISGRP